MSRVLLSYEFDRTNMPPPCKERSKQQYRYLVDGARTGFRSNGELLQNEALGELIHIVFYNTKTGACRLQGDCDIVSMNMIALTYCLTLYRLVQAYKFKVPDPSMRDEFRRQGGYWAWLYKRTMLGKGSDDESIDHQAVQRMQTAIVNKLSGQTGNGPPDSKLLYQATLRDGEYVSSDDNGE
ncbi:hypothetical protein O0I10_011638 [Lichtheimia ornata]|uniref:Uncharacterized protein n=1 Tax=Lichtheimia ornata TaxID=688661 RepID=A0AAD7UT65_9FUNG|nr:uncharacterized protein O0I10_011638 [Lichtheimia ornata]KAJ8652693.1 hypothetical protein O0I10_011638 [Lichtheimia ornata]